MSISRSRRVNWQENSNGPTGLLRPSGRPTAPVSAAQRPGKLLERLLYGTTNFH
jgi:hypothetical protein